MVIMTSPVIQIPVTDLAPYKAANGDTVLVGCYGVSHGSGITGELIRHATESWAGHAFVYVGDGQIVQGEPPCARISPAASHPDAIWNAREQLTDAQREVIVARAHALIGCPYDYPAYIGFTLELLKLGSGTELDSVFREDSWRVCSALVADCYARAGIHLEAGLKYPNLISPADLYNRIAAEN
jgi:cell wall-associated NlpC family hydrolase